MHRRSGMSSSKSSSSSSKIKGMPKHSLKPLREGVLGVPTKKALAELRPYWDALSKSV
jgi:hypothetical protein